MKLEFKPKFATHLALLVLRQQSQTQCVTATPVFYFLGRASGHFQASLCRALHGCLPSV